MARNSKKVAPKKGVKAKTKTSAQTLQKNTVDEAVKAIQATAQEAIAGLKGTDSTKPKRRPNGSCKKGEWKQKWEWVCEV